MPTVDDNGFAVFHSTEVQKIFSGETPYQKCMHCNGTGFENWNENGSDVRPGRNDEDIDRDNGPCAPCHGAGIVPGISLIQQGVVK